MVPILTSSWRTLIDDQHFVRVGISRSVPRGPKGFRRFTALQPGPWFRSITDPRDWSARYEAEVLSKLDPTKLVADLHAMSDGRRAIVLLCWEASETGAADWCHRAMVSAWMHDRLRLEVFELGFEQCGCGRAHPKLPQACRP